MYVCLASPSKGQQSARGKGLISEKGLYCGKLKNDFLRRRANGKQKWRVLEALWEKQVNQDERMGGTLLQVLYCWTTSSAASLLLHCWFTLYKNWVDRDHFSNEFCFPSASTLGSQHSIPRLPQVRPCWTILYLTTYIQCQSSALIQEVVWNMFSETESKRCRKVCILPF